MDDDAQRQDWPAGPADDPLQGNPLQDQSHSDTASFPPRLRSLTTAPADSGSNEVQGEETDSSRASSRIPAHSALSQMLHDSAVCQQGAEPTAAPWSLAAAPPHQGETSPNSAAVKQLMHVVEGLEEELFTSEARRNDAEVQAEGLESSEQELQSGLMQAQQDLIVKRQTVQGLTQKFDRAAVTLGNLDAQIAEKQVALFAAKAQLAAHDKHLMQQDVTIKGLQRKQGQQEGLGASFLKSLHTHFRFPSKAPSSDLVKSSIATAVEETS